MLFVLYKIGYKDPAQSLVPVPIISKTPKIRSIIVSRTIVS